MLAFDSEVIRSVLSIGMSAKKYNVTDPLIIQMIRKWEMHNDDLDSDIFDAFIVSKGLELTYENRYPEEDIQDDFDQNMVVILSIFTLPQLLPYVSHPNFNKFISDRIEIMICGSYGSAIEFSYLPNYDYLDKGIKGVEEFLNQDATFMIATTEFGVRNLDLVTDFTVELDDSIRILKELIHDDTFLSEERRETVA